MSVWEPATSAALAIFAAIILVCFALICATMVLALVQAGHSSAAPAIYGFRGRGDQQELAVSVVRATLGVGARLYALRLIVAIGMASDAAATALFGNATAARERRGNPSDRAWLCSSSLGKFRACLREWPAASASPTVAPLRGAAARRGWCCHDCR